MRPKRRAAPDGSPGPTPSETRSDATLTKPSMGVRQDPAGDGDDWLPGDSDGDDADWLLDDPWWPA